ncbi:MAG: DUF2442 domain-containing protein [Magnetococcus sp. YQC-5]
MLETHPLAVKVVVSAGMLRVILADGRKVATPVAWFLRLQEATEELAFHWWGVGIHWISVDEDISIDTLLMRNESTDAEKVIIMVVY